MVQPRNTPHPATTDTDQTATPHHRTLCGARQRKPRPRNQFSGSLCYMAFSPSIALHLPACALPTWLTSTCMCGSLRKAPTLPGLRPCPPLPGPPLDPPPSPQPLPFPLLLLHLCTSNCFSCFSCVQRPLILAARWGSRGDGSQQPGTRTLTTRCRSHGWRSWCARCCRRGCAPAGVTPPPPTTPPEAHSRPRSRLHRSATDVPHPCDGLQGGERERESGEARWWRVDVQRRQCTPQTSGQSVG